MSRECPCLTSFSVYVVSGKVPDLGSSPLFGDAKCKNQWYASGLININFLD